MSASNDMQKNPGETWILAQANPPVQPTPETSTNPNTTNSNGSTKNNVDNSPQPAVQHTPETNDNGNTATSTTSICFRIPEGYSISQQERIMRSNLERRLEGMRSQLEWMQKKLTHFEKNVVDLGKFHGSASHKDLKSHLERLQDSIKAFSNSEDFGKKEASASIKHTAIRLREIQKEITNLMKHLSPLEAVSKAAESLSSAHLQSSTGSNGRSAVLEFVNGHQRESSFC